MSGTSASDLLIFDLERAAALAQAMSCAGTELAIDSFAVGRVLDEAGDLLHVDARRFVRRDPDLELRRVVRDVEELARDLRHRVDAVRRSQADVTLLADLTGEIGAWTGSPHDPAFVDVSSRRSALLLALLGGDAVVAGAVSRAMDQGLGFVDALETARAEVVFGFRVSALVDAFGITEREARDRVVRIDADLLRLRELGFSERESEAVVALALHYSADLDAALAHARSSDASLIDSMGRVIAGQGLGLSAAEFDALLGLREYFPQLDRTPIGGLTNDRISIAELEFIVENECRFSDGQVAAAAAVLANPELINRLDTAADNDDILGPDRFGSTRPGDGVISLEDIEAFTYKAQLTHLLAPFADDIDVAADPAEVVDGVHSRSDLESFLADADVTGMPAAAVDALTVALDNGWFDRDWFQEHREELAYAAALAAGGAVILVSGGAATPWVLVAAGAAGGAAAGGTILAVNAVSDDELTEGLARGVAAGIVIGVSSAGIVSGSATLARVEGIEKAITTAGVAVDATSVVAAGATDILMPEEIEEQVKDLAGDANGILAPVVALTRQGPLDVAMPTVSDVVLEE